MMDLVDFLGALIRLNGGKIVGKTRLQKIAYLLESKGIGFGDLDFDYHNYGPFSAELAFAADDAESLGYIRTTSRQGFHSVPYIIYESTSSAPKFGRNAKTTRRRSALELMVEYDSLVLELAATAVYLKSNGYEDSYWDEVKRRKSLKADPKRLRRAKELLEKLELS